MQRESTVLSRANGILLSFVTNWIPNPTCSKQTFFFYNFFVDFYNFSSEKIYKKIVDFFRRAIFSTISAENCRFFTEVDFFYNFSWKQAGNSTALMNLRKIYSVSNIGSGTFFSTNYLLKTLKFSRCARLSSKTVSCRSISIILLERCWNTRGQSRECLSV